MCSDGHMQCHVCHDRCDGRCGFCMNVTQFVQMSIKPPIVAQTSPLLSAGEEKETPPSFQTPTILEEIQSQSNISQEHMSMIDSNAEGSEQESVNQNITHDLSKKSEKDSNLKKQESSEKHPRELNQTSNETNKLLNGSLNSNRLTLDTSQNLHCSISQSYQSSSNPISRDGVSKDNAFVFHDVSLKISYFILSLP